MNFRARLFFIFLISVLVPVVILGWLIRGEMTGRITEQYRGRVESLMEVIAGDLDSRGASIARSIETLGEGMTDDNRFRRVLTDRQGDDRRYLLDYAGRAMKMSGLSMLQIQDQSGRIISSGHFRNEYDRIDEALTELLSVVPGQMAIVEVRAPDEPFMVLTRMESLSIGGKKFTIVGGVKVDEAFLGRLATADDLMVRLVCPRGVFSVSGETIRQDTTETGDSGGAIVREMGIPFIDLARSGPGTAFFRASHSMAKLDDLKVGIDKWFLLILVVTGMLSLILVSWLSTMISRPLIDLADRTAGLDLDRLDVEFDVGRGDEIGTLSRVLGEMTARLRSSAVRIRDAERRATLGELARQVNHDIKNGLTPIRNVFRHLEEVAGNEPARLPEVFEERSGTVDSSIGYLEKLASNYARLSPAVAKTDVDLDDIITRVLADYRVAGNVELVEDLCGEAFVHGDPLSLRRIVENLAGNAIGSLGPEGGTVTVHTGINDDDGADPSIILRVSDTGCGISEEKMDMVFEDFYTTRELGTGLGLSIVRRLVMDLDGSIEVSSEEGRGSVFSIEMPARCRPGEGKEI
ncbi:MAG: HAMP domain-containing histidine kinase [Bacteroidales bacterium]|nr:HAMP domain-containing histidine kinase [Candidatus Latescibacterota bacterium]